MSNTEESAKVKLFISYSWSSPDHEAWVVSFAEELVSQGVNVILDKWDLQPGQDANEFMESMVTDSSVTKVVLICDKVYADKSNRRTGGAGTEAQILTPELYNKKDQSKYVAVIRERNEEGVAYLPTYYGSRIYIDLCDSANYGSEFEKLLRWIWDKPLYVRPPLGQAPNFVTNPKLTAKIGTSVAHRRAIDAIRNGHPGAVAATTEYLDLIVGGMEEFRIKRNDTDEFDAQVVESIEEFIPYRNEIIELCKTIALYQPDEQFVAAVHRFLEKLLPFYDRTPNMNAWNLDDFDGFKFIVHELFLYIIAIFIKSERFDAAAYFFNNGYYNDKQNGSEPFVNYRAFRQHMTSLEDRNKRLQKNRLSLRADMLHDRAASSGVDFRYVMAADFIAYIRSLENDVWFIWWPETLLYASDHRGSTFEMFARSSSHAYFERVKPLLGVANKDELAKRLETIRADRDKIPRWQFQSINPKSLLGLDGIATRP